MNRRPKLFEVVTLARPVPEHGLAAGAQGAVLELYDPDGVEVEFLDADGSHLAVLTLRDHDVRCRSDGEPGAFPQTHPWR